MPQEAWNAKRERQYEHIKTGLEQRGAAEERAEEIAARTVNKERARTGEARQSSRSSRHDISSGRRGGLRSGTRRQKGQTKEQLYNQAKRLNIKGRSKMNKSQLLAAVNRKKS
jgi:plasmid stabilization system protein ParE